MRSLLAAIAIGVVTAGPVAAERPKDVAIPAGHVLPAEYLASLRAPAFAPGHTLPRLTRYASVLDFDTRVDFARRWGYALEWGTLTWQNSYATKDAVDLALSDPQSDSAKCMRLAAEEPETFKLAITCCRDLPAQDAVPPETWTRDAAGAFLTDKTSGHDGNTWSDGVDRIFSPAAPESVWREAGRLRAEQLRRIRARCPIAIVLNGGEYGLGVPGFAQKYWEQDPGIVKAKGEMSWAEFASRAKARAETLIADEVRAAVPDRDLYIYYTCSGGGSRNRWPGWADWGPAYEHFAGVSDLPSGEHYYRHGNSGWTGKTDILTTALNARGREIAAGHPLSYDWLADGWDGNKGMNGGENDTEGDNGLGDIARYRGFLKCMFTAGMIGGNAGYYSFPKGYEGTSLAGFRQPFPPDHPPHWLLQMVALAEVQAMFSHVEKYLRDGDLLPGPDRHVWSKDQPAYEFRAGTTARVLVRRLRKEPRWLVTAWAADGVTHDVDVEIPELGRIQIEARPDATVAEAAIGKDGPTLQEIATKKSEVMPEARP